MIIVSPPILYFSIEERKMDIYKLNDEKVTHSSPFSMYNENDMDNLYKYKNPVLRLPTMVCRSAEVVQNSKDGIGNSLKLQSAVLSFNSVGFFS